jgi:hypothetical protein
MSRGLKLGLLLTATMLSGALAASAGAAFWHTNGDKPFSSTDAGIWRLIIDPPSGSQVTLQCPTSRVSGTLNGPTFLSIGGWNAAATVTPVLGAAGNCMLNGVMGFTVVCSSAELRADTYAGGHLLSTAGGGVTTGALTGVDCRLSAGGSTCSTITGTVPVHYINPNPLATGAGSLTATRGGALTVSKIGAGCVAAPHGTGTWGSPNGAGVADATYVVDGPNAPYIYRDPTS